MCTLVLNVHESQEEDPKKKKPDVANRAMPDPDRLRLYAESAGFCCFPGCDELLTESEDGATENSGQIAHIRGREAGSARYEENYPLLDSYENTILLCYRHHHRIDYVGTRSKFPLNTVLDMKKEAKQKFANFQRLRPGSPSLELVDELCRAIIGAVTTPDVNFDAIRLEEKINVNDLSAPLAAQIRSDLAQRKVIADFLEVKARTDPSYPERIQAAIKARYLDLVSNGIQGEDAYRSMTVIVRGKKTDIESGNAAQKICAYFFQMCDILELA